MFMLCAHSIIIIIVGTDFIDLKVIGTSITIFFFNFINVEIQELQVGITRSLYRLTHYTYLILVDINN